MSAGDIFTRAVQFAGLASFSWLVYSNYVTGQYFPLIALGVVIGAIAIVISKARKEKRLATERAKQQLMEPYYFNDQEFSLDFIEYAGAARSRCHLHLSGGVISRVEGWKLFDSGHDLEGGSLENVGQKYEFATKAMAFIAKPGELKESLTIVRVLGTPLPRDKEVRFSHWCDLINCYPKPSEEFGLRVDYPIHGSLTLAIKFLPGQPHNGLQFITFDGHSRTHAAALQYKVTQLADGSLRYASLVNTPKKGTVYAVLWNQ